MQNRHDLNHQDPYHQDHMKTSNQIGQVGQLDQVGQIGRIADSDQTDSAGDPLINVTELGQYIKRKRESERLSLRAVAKQTQVSASTLSRIENGAGVPDTPTLARLAKWLNIPFERVMTGANSKDAPIIYYPQESIPDIVAAHLRADPNLTPELARALEDLFRVAYNQFSVRK